MGNQPGKSGKRVSEEGLDEVKTPKKKNASKHVDKPGGGKFTSLLRGASRQNIPLGGEGVSVSNIDAAPKASSSQKPRAPDPPGSKKIVDKSPGLESQKGYESWISPQISVKSHMNANFLF